MRLFDGTWFFFFLLGGPIITAEAVMAQIDRPQVFVFTDINLAGGDPDDRQSLIHLLWYADVLDIKGIVPDRWNGGGYQACLLALDAYREDYQRFNFASKGFASPGELQELFAENEVDAAGKFKAAIQHSKKPLYVLVWGNMASLERMLGLYPEASSKVRIISIGTGRKYGPRDEVAGEDCHASNWNGKGRDSIFLNSKYNHIWWLENNWTYNGMFMGDGPTEMFQALQQFGAMGQHIKDVTNDHAWAQYFRVGDTPSVLYLIDPDHQKDDPTQPSWAGKFKRPFPVERPNYYTDDNGTIEWNYRDPCQTWHNLKAMYAYNKQTLLDRRQQMYDQLLKKLTLMYE